MKVLEITIFVINEVIGRNYIGAVDAGDTIFVHIFGAYFGLTVARYSEASFGVFDPALIITKYTLSVHSLNSVDNRVLARPDIAKSNLEGATATSDLFSMVGL